MIFESFSFFSFCKKGAKEDEYEDDFEPEPKKDEDEYADDFEAEDPPPGSDSCTKTHKSYKILWILVHFLSIIIENFHSFSDLGVSNYCLNIFWK